MNTPEFILQALFFVVNSFALCFLVWYVGLSIKRMRKELGEAVSFMRRVKARNDSTYIYMLKKVLGMLVEQERYEEAAKIKKMIDEELKDLNDKEL